MKIRKIDSYIDIECDIDFSRPLTIFSKTAVFNVPVVSKIDRFMIQLPFWANDIGVEVIIDGDRYMPDKDHPKEFERLKKNLEALFALHSLK